MNKAIINAIIIHLFSICLYSQWNLTLEQYYVSKFTSIVNLEEKNLAIFEAKEDSLSNYRLYILDIENDGSINSIDRLSDSTDAENSGKIYQAEENNIVVLAYKPSNKKIVLYKIDENLNLVWRKTYGEDEFTESGYDFKLLSNGNYLITGGTDSQSQYYDLWFLIINSESGEIINSNIVPLMYGFSSYAFTFKVDGGYACFANRVMENSIGNLISTHFMIKLDDNFNLIDEVIYISEDLRIYIYDTIKTSDGGYISIGESYDQQSHYGGWYIIKVDSNFQEIWRRYLYGDQLRKYSTALHIIETLNNEYIVVGDRDQEGNMGAGILKSDFAITKFNINGDIIWEVSLSGCEKASLAHCVAETPDRDIVTVGHRNGVWEGAKKDGYIVVVDEDGNHNVDIEANYEQGIKNYELKQNYPNPFNPFTRINYELSSNDYELAEIVIYNVKGQEIWTRKLNTNFNSIVLEGSTFDSGIYYYSLIIDGKFVSTKKMILIK